MVGVDVSRADEAAWAHVAAPSGRGLDPLPAPVWNSWEMREAADDHPGAVIAAARRAHGLSQAQLGSLAGFSQSAISRIESGGNLAFDLRMLRVFQRVLGIPAGLLGLSGGAFPVPAEDARRLGPPLPHGTRVPVAVDAHTLAAACTSAALATVPVDALGELDEDRPVDPDIVRRLLVIRRLLNDSDNWLGSRHLAGAVRDLYELVHRVRRAASGELRRQLLDVAALYAEFCGWLHQEAGDRRVGRMWTERALRQAEAAEDRELVGYARIRLANFAEAERDGDRVVALARQARREPLSGAVRTLAVEAEARGHALAGDTTSCLAMLDEALAVGERLRRPERPDGYVVGSYFTIEHLHADQAGCLVELGRWDEAIARYRAHETGRATLCEWEQGVHLAKLARAYAEKGEYERAAALGADAVAIGRRTASLLVVDAVRPLAAWDRVPAVAALADALGE